MVDGGVETRSVTKDRVKGKESKGGGGFILGPGSPSVRIPSPFTPLPWYAIV